MRFIVLLLILSLALVGCSPDESVYALIQGQSHTDNSTITLRGSIVGVR